MNNQTFSIMEIGIKYEMYRHKTKFETIKKYISKKNFKFEKNFDFMILWFDQKCIIISEKIRNIGNFYDLLFEYFSNHDPKNYFEKKLFDKLLDRLDINALKIDSIDHLI